MPRWPREQLAPWWAPPRSAQRQPRWPLPGEGEEPVFHGASRGRALRPDADGHTRGLRGHRRRCGASSLVLDVGQDLLGLLRRNAEVGHRRPVLLDELRRRWIAAGDHLVRGRDEVDQPIVRPLGRDSLKIRTHQPPATYSVAA